MSGTIAPIDLTTIGGGTGGFVIHGQDASDFSGFSVASAGDINGDGFADLIIGAYWGDAAGNAKGNAGDSYVVFGKASGWGATIDLANIASGTGGFIIHGQDGGDFSGNPVASAGDVNGDGFADLIIGARYGDAAGNGKNYAGDSYVVFGKASGWGAAIDLTTIAAGTGGFVIHGQDGLDFSGFSVASAGDINGDGFADLIIGAPNGDAAGNARSDAGDSYVVFGKASGWGAAIDLATIAAGTGGFVIHGQDSSDYSGRSVASAGDINGDGLADLIIGAFGGDASGNLKSNAGDSYVVFGKASGWGAAIGLATIAAGTGGFVIHGQDRDDRSGVSVASAGDINGDGFADLIIGASGGDAAGNAKSNAGDSYVVFGKASAWGATIDLATIASGTGGFVIRGQDRGDQSGFSVASAGDINGDGFADLIIGARYGDAAGNAKDGAGDSYVVFGKAAGWGAAIDLATIAAGTGGFVIHGQDSNDQSGFSVASAGDINGDGFADLIIGAYQADAAGNAKSNAGDSYVIFGRDFTNTVTHGGTASAEVLTGTNVANVMVAGLGNDTLDGLGGADALKGGAGDDRIQISDLTFLNIDGGSGTDTLALTGSGLTLNLASIGDTKLQDIEAIDLGVGGNTLRLTALEVRNLSETSNTLRVTGGTGASVQFDDTGWVRGATSGGFVTFTNGSATALVAQALLAPPPSGPTNGDDNLAGTAGNDSIDGLAGNDSILGDAGNDTLAGGAGADTLRGGAGNDSLAGGDGADLVSYAELTGATQAVTVDLATQRATGAAGSDTLFGIENALGGAGNDSLLGDGNANALNGGAGNDTLSGGLGNDSLAGDGGADLVSYAELTGATQAVTVDLAAQRATGAAGADTLSGIENVLAGVGNDSLLGDGNANALNGGAGNDTLSGGLGNDSLAGDGGADLVSYAELTGATQAVTVDLAAQRATGAAGADTLSGIENVLAGAGNDSLLGDGNANALNGGAGNDTLSGGLGNDSLAGDGGADLVSYAELTGATQAITVDLAAQRATGAAGSDTLFGIENALGGAGNDSLLGDGNANTLSGGLGDDTLSGGVGNDSLDGGAGDDRIQITGLTFLNIDAGSGTDTLALTGSGFMLNLADIADTRLQGIEAIDLGSGGNSLRLTALEVLNLSNTSNTLRVTGGTGASIAFDDTGWVQGATSGGFVTFTNGTATALVAQALLAPLPAGPTIGNDNLAGSSGNDSIDGLAGNDSILGAAGNDTLSGGVGADTLAGGLGNDLFFVTDAGDVVIELAGGGADTIIASVNMTMPDQVEVLQIASGISGVTITGGTGNDMLIGNALANNFNGGAGDDVVLAGNVTLADIHALFAT